MRRPWTSCTIGLCLALPAGALAGNVYVPLAIDETSGLDRAGSPVTAGVALPLGRVGAAAELRVLDPSGQAVAAQIAALAAWPDGSLKWVLADFPATVAAGATAGYALTQDPYTPMPAPAAAIRLTETAATLTVDTGAAVFTIPRSGFRGFSSVRVGATELVAAPGSDLLLTAGGVAYATSRDPSSSVNVEESGPLRLAVLATGTFRDGAGTALLGYRARLHFQAGLGAVRFFLTLVNPIAAVHPNNVWDLGSTGSRYLDDLSLALPLALAGPYTASVVGEAAAPIALAPVNQPLTLYQESSGGARWDWPTHVNRFNLVPLTFRGYQVREGAAVVAAGNRARGRLDLSAASGGIAVGVRHFWQNFPKSLRADPAGVVSVGLFPGEFPEAHEIQGGEEKTHEVLLLFHPGDEASSGALARIADLADPLHARPDAGATARSRALPSLGPRDLAAFPGWEDTVEYIALDKGVRSFFTQREEIDEYGWRDFGDAFADHETACGTQCWDCPVSHDNNQYDYDFAALRLWIRNREPAWRDLAEQGLRHLMDIDVYHTDGDTPAYNRGLFWHTTHDTDAYTATHRTYSARMSAACTPYLSGGPALDHLYGEGLLLYGYLSGDRRAFEVHDELERYLETRYALDAPGPGYEPRAWANALVTAVGAAGRAGDPGRYALARRIVADSAAGANPAIDGTSFQDSMLMVALGRFLDLKEERGELGDADAAVARGSLLGYAARVRANRPPATDVLDFRYSEAMWYAYRYAPAGDPDRTAWRDLARAFFAAGEQTGFFRTYITCKGLAHTATNGHLHTYYERGRIPAAASRLTAVKAAGAATGDVALAWRPPAADVHADPIGIGEYRVYRAAARPTRFTDRALATTPLPAHVASGDLPPAAGALLFYEARAVGSPGIEGE